MGSRTIEILKVGIDRSEQNSADPHQTAPTAVRPTSTLFAIPCASFRPITITNFSSKNTPNYYLYCLEIGKVCFALYCLEIGKVCFAMYAVLHTSQSTLFQFQDNKGNNLGVQYCIHRKAHFSNFKTIKVIIWGVFRTEISYRKGTCCYKNSSLTSLI